MSNQIIIKTQNHCMALRQLIGYPLEAPVNHTLAFASGGPADGHTLLELARHATAMQRDLVYAAWERFSRPEPAELVLAIRELTHVDVITGCFAWAADADAPLLLVAPQRGEQFVLGARGWLERRPGLPATQLGRGRRIARQRIRQVASTRATELLPDNQLVAPGADWVRPAPKPEMCVMRVG